MPLFCEEVFNGINKKKGEGDATEYEVCISVGNLNTNSRISSTEYSASNIQINLSYFKYFMKSNALSLLEHSSSQNT